MLFILCTLSLTFVFIYARTGVPPIPERPPNREMEAQGKAESAAFAPNHARETAGGEASAAVSSGGEHERASIQASSYMNSDIPEAAAAMAEGQAGMAGGKDGPSASFSAGSRGELEGDVRLSDTKEAEINALGENVETGEEALKEWKSKRVEPQFASMYEKLSKEGGGVNVMSHLESNSRTHLTYNPGFGEYLDEGVTIKVVADVEGANIPVLTGDKRIPPNFDDTIFTREVSFISSCERFIVKEEMKLDLTRAAGAGDGFDQEAWETCLNEDCASRFGTFYANVHEAGKAARDAIESFCVIPPTDAKNKHNALTAGRCAVFNVPCRCMKTDVVRPELNFHKITWEHTLGATVEERMKFQICFAELSSLVYKLKAESGSKSSIQVHTSEAALYSPMPNEFKRLYAVEAKLVTNAFLASSIREEFLEKFKDLFHMDFYVQIEGVAFKYAREDNVDEVFRQDFSASSKKTVTEEWLAGGILEASSAVSRAFREISEIEYKANKLTAGMEVNEWSSEHISEEVTASLRVDVAQILESLSLFLDSAIANGHLGVLSMASFIARFHVEKMALKYFIQQIKAHKRRWMRFEKLEQDMQSKADVDDATLSCWIDECKIAGNLAMEKLETEMIAAFRLEQRRKGLAAAKAHDYSKRDIREKVHGHGTHAAATAQGIAVGSSAWEKDTAFTNEYNYDDEELDEFLQEEAMGDFEMTLKGRRCRGPADFSMFGTGDFDRRACSICIMEAKEEMQRAHRGNLDRDYEALRGFIQKLNLVQNTLRTSAAQRLTNALMELNNVVTLHTENGDADSLISKIFVEPDTVELNQGSLAMDEVYIQAVLEAGNPELTYILLDSLFMASTRYRAEDVSVEIIGFFRDLKAQQCTVFVPNFFTPFVCDKKEPKSIQANGISSSLDVHLRYSSVEWSVDQGFIASDGEEGQRGAGKVWMLFPAEPEKTFALDCGTVGDSEAEKEEFMKNLDEWGQNASPMSPDYMTLPDVGKFQHISCNAYCLNVIKRQATESGYALAEGTQARCNIELSPQGRLGHCQMYVGEMGPEPVDGQATEGPINKVEKWMDLENPVSCTPAETGCLEAEPEAGGAGSKGRKMMEYWRKYDPVRRMTNMLMGGQIANLGGPASKVMKETSFQLAQRPRLSTWISGLGGITCESISGLVNQWLLQMVDMPYDSYNFRFSVRWNGANVKRVIKEIESDSNLYGSFRLNILKIVEEVLKRHLILITSEGEVVNDPTLRSVISDVFVNGVSLGACEKDMFCIGIDIAKLTAQVFHANTLGLKLDIQSFQSMRNFIEKGLCSAVPSSREFVLAGMTGQVDCELEMNLIERYRIGEEESVRGMHPEKQKGGARGSLTPLTIIIIALCVLVH